ncbi:MAG: hypothetical protein H6714_03515 [Myxococcales bacterium]|nr:hypothetical protein [Myxococcales bacterium]
MTTLTHTGSGRGSAAIAERIIHEQDNTCLLAYARQLGHERGATMIMAARVLEEVVSKRPEFGTGIISALVDGLFSSHPRVVQMSANTLPCVTRAAPAKVAKHLTRINERFCAACEVAQEGIIRTYVALCLASVTYHRKLEAVFQSILRDAAPPQLAVCADLLLPALKGQPHASCRDIVEGRLGDLPQDWAQKIARGLGIKLRMSMCG